MGSYRIIVFLVASLILFPGPQLIAQTSTARFLLWQPSAVSDAMGGAGVAFHRDIYAASYNPSALAFAEGIRAGGSFEKPVPFLGNMAYSFFGLSTTTRSIGTFAASVNLYSMGKQARTLNDPNIIGADEASHWQAKLSYAFALSSTAAFGVSASFLHIGLSKFGTGAEEGTGRTNAPLVDVGFLVRNILKDATVEGRGGNR